MGVVLAMRTSNNPIVLSTVSGETNEIQQLSLVKLSDMHNIEIIYIPSMDINSYNITVPQQYGFEGVTGQCIEDLYSHENYDSPKGKKYSVQHNCRFKNSLPAENTQSRLTSHLNYTRHPHNVAKPNQSVQQCTQDTPATHINLDPDTNVDQSARRCKIPTSMSPQGYATDAHPKRSF